MKQYYEEESGEIVSAPNIWAARRYFKAEGKRFGFKPKVRRWKSKQTETLSNPLDIF